MKHYDKYKELSIEWLGKIPDNWETRRLKSIAEIKTGYTPSREESENFSNSKDGIIWIKPDDLNGDKPITTSKEKISFDSIKSNKLATVNTILVNCIGDVGKVGINGIEALFNQQINSVKFNPDLIEQKYGLYLIMSSKEEHKRLSCINVVPILNQTRQGEIRLPLPKNEIQQEIVHKIARFSLICDKFVSQKKKYIELLKEYKQAKINEIVTGGLRQNQALKPSGAEWLPFIPHNWKISKIRHLFFHNKESASVNNSYKLISLYTETGVDYRENLEQKGNKASTTDNYWIVREGDIIINKLLAWMGAIGYSALEGVTSPAYDVIRSKDLTKFNPQYYGLVFRIPILKTEYRRYSRGILDMKLRLYFSDMGQIMFPVPPYNEQCEIVNEVDKISDKYSELISKAKKQIELIQEYRQSLIYELVTGKRKP